MPYTLPKEFTELPDEFEGQKSYAEPERERKRNGWKWLVSAALVLLILPMSVLTQFLRTESLIPEAEIIEPVPEPVPVDVIDEPVETDDGTHPDYDIIGLWHYENETYWFAPDGNGFYCNGDYYLFVSWEEAETDYAYTGGGMTGYEERSTQSIVFTDFTHPGDGGLYLQSHETGGQQLFIPAQSINMPEAMITAIDETPEERVMGYWHMEKSLDPTCSVYAYYVDIADGGKAMLHMHSYTDEDYFIDLKYELDPDEPFRLILKDAGGGDIYYEFRDEMDYLNTYNADELYIIYFIDGDGEGIIINDFSGGTLLRKEVDY